MTEWPRYALRDVAPAIPAENTFEPADLVWQLGLDQIDGHTGVVLRKHRAPASNAGNSTIHFDQSHVLYSKLRPYLNKVEVPDEPGIATTELISLQPHSHVICREYLAYYLRSPGFLRYSAQYVTGAKMPRVILDRFWTHEIPVPLLSEQRRIVEILDQANRLRSLRAAGDAKAERLCRVLFMRMFGNPATFWRIGRLGDLLRRRQGALQSGPFGTDLHTSDFVPSGKILAVGIDNVLDGEFVLGRNRRITPEKYQELTKYTLDPGDVLITIMGTVGRTCVFPGTPSPAICTKHVYRMQLNESVHPEYLSATLRFSEAVRAQIGAGITGQTVSGIKSKDLRRLQLSIPPAELQAEFAAGKEKIDAIQQRARSARKACEALFSLLAHRAFRAELTASWREAHMKELLQEMEQQARTSSQEVPRP